MFDVQLLSFSVNNQLYRATDLNEEYNNQIAVSDAKRSGVQLEREDLRVCTHY